MKSFLSCIAVACAFIFAICHLIILMAGPSTGSRYVYEATNEEWVVESVGTCVGGRHGRCSYKISNGQSFVYLESGRAYSIGQTLFWSKWKGPFGGEHSSIGTRPQMNIEGPGLFFGMF